MQRYGVSFFGQCKPRPPVPEIVNDETDGLLELEKSVEINEADCGPTVPLHRENLQAEVHGQVVFAHGGKQDATVRSVRLHCHRYRKVVGKRSWQNGVCTTLHVRVQGKVERR